MIREFLLKFFRFTKEQSLIENTSQISNTKKSPKDSRDILMETSSAPYQTSAQIMPIPKVRNQGSIGSCCSHAVIRATEYQLLARNRYIEGSELYHYYCARAYVNETYPFDKGMTIRDGLKTAYKFGYAPESTWPYDVMMFNKKPGMAAFWMSSLFKVLRYEKITDISSIKDSIVEGIPVVFGIRVDDSFYQLSSSKYTWKPSGNSNGGHAVLITGYDDNKQCFIVDNSWGSSWGNRGKFLIPYDIMPTKWTFDWYRLILK